MRSLKCKADVFGRAWYFAFSRGSGADSDGSEGNLNDLFRDFRYAVRALLKERRFAAIAIFALALGIGASTIVFSVMDSVFLHALPYKDFQRSVVVKIRDLAKVGRKDRVYFSSEEFRAFREQNHAFEDVIGYIGTRPSYDDGKTIRNFAIGAAVTANTFDYLGVAPLFGRTITPEDSKASAPPVFVMNYRLWQKEFAGDPQVLGKVLVLNGKPTTLVGIMPLKFNAFGSSFWAPLTPDSWRRATPRMIGRLKRGVALEAARAELDGIAHRMHRPDPDGVFPEAQFVVVSETLLDSLAGNFKKVVYALLAAVTLLLLIACSNVANLLLARATTREREIAMRATLGASRGRLIQQLLAESFVLATVACGTGCLLAYVGLKIVVALIPAGALPEETVIRMSAPILLAALGLAVLTAVLCSVAPVLHVVCGYLQPRLAGTTKSAGGDPQSGKMRAGLVIGEVALSMVLLIGAGLLMRSFLVLTRVDLGFNPKNILYFELNLPPSYNTSFPDTLERKNVLTRQLLDRLSALPGVTSVTEAAEPPPLQYEASDIVIPGKPHSERWETRFEMCSEGYFRMLGLPLLRGRLFSQDDVAASRDVMVVNEAFSRRYFPNEDPLGHRVKLRYLDSPFLSAPRDTYFEIVGIVRDFKTRGYDDPSWQTFPQSYLPYSVSNYNWRVFMARTSVDANLILKNVGQEVHAIDPGVQIGASGTLEGALKEFYRGPRFEFVTLTAFALIGLTLVVIGIFSVMAYAVTLRTREIGVRMALGAQRTNVLSLVLASGFRLVAAGIVVGLLASYPLTRFLSAQIPGVSPTDSWTFGAVVMVVLSAALMGCLAPARRAARLDPLETLRYE
jgi:putative ABC transport system permease protein